MLEFNDTYARERARKVAELRALGVDPFPPAAFHPGTAVATIQADPERWIADGSLIRIAGRLVGRRDMGKVTFADMLDQGSRIQLFIRRPDMDDLETKVLDLLDLGDFVGCDGTVFRTRAGEVTVAVSKLTVLAKAAQSIPIGKASAGGIHDALADSGKIARQRHVALNADPTVRRRFVDRASILREIRRYFEEEGFLEVETPTLGTAYGGAAARPFTTHVNSLDTDLYLRISPECNLKRILCGGIDKVFEIGRNFRNEGIDASHNPEFCMMEWYEAYSDYRHQMERFETLIPRLADVVNGSTRVIFRGRPLDLAAPWRRMPVIDALREEISTDLLEVEAADMPRVVAMFHPAGNEALAVGASWGDGVMALFESLIEPRLWEPTFVMDHPLDISPLTKQHRANGRLVERFEPMIGGMEIGNAYSELNDPWEQFARLAGQQKGREENYDLDADFLDAIAHGMPQAGGSGLGIDRIVMILTGAQSIRDVMLFPLVAG